MSALDTQEGGSHYKNLAIQPVEFITRNGIGFLEGNAIKYLVRHHHKGGAEDIRKAMHYCQMILELTYGAPQEVAVQEQIRLDREIVQQLRRELFRAESYVP